MQTQEPADIWKPALVSGTLFGVASAIPFVGYLNCACCSLVVGSGVMACYMMVKGSVVPVTWGRAALAGTVSGAIAAIVSSMVQLLVMIALGHSIEENINQAIDSAGQYMPNAAEAGQILSNIPPILFVMVTAMIALVLYAPFGALGGVIGRALFEKRTPPPAGESVQTTIPPGPPPTLDI